MGRRAVLSHRPDRPTGPPAPAGAKPVTTAGEHGRVDAAKSCEAVPRDRQHEATRGTADTITRGVRRSAVRTPAHERGNTIGRSRWGALVFEGPVSAGSVCLRCTVGKVRPCARWVVDAPYGRSVVEGDTLRVLALLQLVLAVAVFSWLGLVRHVDDAGGLCGDRPVALIAVLGYEHQAGEETLENSCRYYAIVDTAQAAAPTVGFLFTGLMLVLLADRADRPSARG